MALAAEIISKELRKGDGFAVAPQWSGAERHRFAHVWASKGLDFLSAWVPGEPLDRWDADGHKRLWLLTTHDAKPDLSAFGTELRAEVLGPGMRLRLLRLPPSETVLDLQKRLLDADVRRVGPKRGQEQRCRAAGDKQRCGGEWWRDLFVGLNEVGNSRRRCIFAQPHPDGAVLKVRWDELPAAQAVAGRVGNRLWAVRHEEGSPVRFAVRVGDTIRHEQTLAPADFGWHAWRVPLAARERGLPVTLELSAASATWRQVCFDARLVGPVPGGARAKRRDEAPRATDAPPQAPRGPAASATVTGRAR